MAEASARVALREGRRRRPPPRARWPQRGRALSRRRSGCSLRDALRGGVLQLARYDASAGPHANICSCQTRAGEHPARRPRRVLRVGRAARRPAAARPAGDRRRRASCSPPATRRRRSACAPRWAAREARRLCPHAIVVPPRGCRPTPRPARRCSRSSTTPRRWSRASRSTRRSSTSAGCERIAGTPAEIAVRLRRAVLEQVGLPITVGVARTKFLAKVASGVAKPDGLLVVPPDGELEFLHPLPVERLWGVGPVTARKLHARGITTVGDVARLGEAALVAHPRPRGRAGTCTRWRTTATRGRCRSAAGGARSARSARSGRGGARRRRSSTSTLVALVDRVRAPAARGAARVGRTVMLRLRFDDFSRATRSHTLPEPTDRTPDDPRRGARAAARPRCRLIERGPHAASGSRSATSTTTARSSSRCRSSARARDALDSDARRRARPLRLGRHHPRRAARPRPRPRPPCCPTDAAWPRP